MNVGSGDYSYEVLADWAKLPPDWSFQDVAGLAVDSKDRVLVFHRGKHPVIILSREGEVEGSWGDKVFTLAHSIRVGPDRMVYCIDYGDHTVRKLSPEGDVLLTLGNPGKPSPTGAVGFDYRTIQRVGGPFNRPTDIAFDSSGDIYVSDGYCNARIHQFSREGELLNSWGQPGSGPGQFHIPHGIVIDNERRLVVADRENSRIQILSLQGDFISEWNNVNRPASALLDAEGNAFVAEFGFTRENMYPDTPLPPQGEVFPRFTIRSREGSILTEWGNKNRCEPGSFFAPHSIAMDSRGDIYVGEVTTTTKAPAGCHALQKFVRKRQSS